MLRDRRPSTALPSLLGVGHKGIEIMYCTVRKNILCTGPIRAAKAEQKSLVPALQAPRTNQERTPFICPFWAPIHHSFNSQQGPERLERGGWHLLTCWNWGEWGLKVLVLHACRRDFCYALAALVGRVENIFFLPELLFQFLCPITQQARQAAVLGRLSLSTCLWQGPPLSSISG
jgi:hypothetical protein